MKTNNIINDWSVVPTPDNLGLALKPLFEDQYEICVAIREGYIEVSLHADGVYSELASMTYKVSYQLTADDIAMPTID